MDKKDKVSKNYRRKKQTGMAKYATKEYVDNLVDISIEDKYFDQGANDIVLTSLTGPNNPIFQLTEIPQGDLATERVGIRVKPKSISIRLVYNGRRTVSNDNTQTIIRLIVFQWKMDNTADVPILADLFLAPVGIDIQTLQHYRLATKDKYRVIFTKIITLNNVDEASQFHDQDDLYKSFSKSQQHLLFVDEGLATTGQYYMALFCNKGNTTDGPRCSFVSRFRFEDA